MNFFKKIPISILNLLYPCKIYGKENMPKDGAVLVCNHFSALDFLFIMRASNTDLHILAKNELFKNKLLGKAFSAYGAISIDRECPDMKSLLKIIKLLKNDEKVAIFPEGTRNKSKTNELQEIKGGAGVFALKAKCEIVPMMMLKKARMFRKTKLIIGKPFDLSEYYGVKLDDGVIKAIDDKVSEKMKEQYAILLEITEKGKRK
ncbi:MAG: 1-acyl-sn-glycerol-3-phosphate acyltransferase [Clostridia bacterium]|nr:1-acyl-sn-glycerol-3-phosphate acyltransferase [Clostridia bacterium]